MKTMNICRQCKHLNLALASKIMRCAATELEKSTSEEYGFTSIENYGKLKVPDRCPYLLEHIVNA